jgi:hypothetical protein
MWTFSKVIGGEVNPVPIIWVRGGHGEFFKCLEQGGVIAVCGVKVVGTKDGYKQLKFALIDKSSDGSTDRDGINGRGITSEEKSRVGIHCGKVRSKMDCVSKKMREW